MQSKKKKNRDLQHTQQMMNLKRFVPLRIGDSPADGIEGEDGTLFVYLLLKPDNISVLGRGEVLSRIRNLQNVLQDIAQVDMLCLSSAQNYEHNKRYYRSLADQTDNPIVRRLCMAEIDYLEEINISMSTSREFALILKYPAGRLDEARHSIMQALQLIKEHRFRVSIASRYQLMHLMSIYYVGDIYSETIPEYDGLQYIGKENNPYGL